jgi:hypothetical protein
MTTSQIVNKLQQLEERMGACDVPRMEFIPDYVEASDGSPTGKVTRVRYGSSGQIISKEELWVDPETILQRSRR